MDILSFEDISKISFSDKVNEIFNEISENTIENIDFDSKLLVQTDLDGVIQYANETFKGYFGKEKDSVIGKPIHLFDHPSVPKSVLRHIQEQVNLDDDTNAVFINKTLDNTFIISYAEVDVIKDRHGDHIHIYTRRIPIVNDNIFEVIIPFYKFLLKKEEEQGVEAAYEYIDKFIERNGFKDFNALMDYIAFRK
ncbi:MAG: PAS domain-containing protein [Capnocytophaga sp.]|nr:PAS domain-containing protein [Capnocytophaga sp.]